MDQFEKEEAIRLELCKRFEAEAEIKEAETLRQEILILLNFGHSEEEILPEIMSHHSLSREKAEELLRSAKADTAING